MQTCEVCGWDTRSDTRVCIACRKAGRQSTAARDDRAESEQLLSAILRSTRGNRPTADDATTAVDRAAREALIPDGRGLDAPGDGHSEQVVLRELDPVQSEAPTVDDPPTDETSDRESSVTASLLHALTGDAGPGESSSSATPPRSRSPRDGDTSDVVDIADALSALDAARRRRAGPAQPAGRDRHGAPDTRFTDAATEENDRTVAATDAEQGADEGDRGDADATSDTEPTPDPPDPDLPTDDASARTDELRAVGDDAGAIDRAPNGRGLVIVAGPATTPSGDASEAASGGEPESLRTRLRTAFREIGAWTAVAQLALIVTGLLCVFQVVVLVVLLRFLLLPTTRDTGSATDALAAHGRAINVMLPALVACALVVVGLTIWHARRARDQAHGSNRPTSVPTSLWVMIAAASMVAGVVVVDASSTVEQAAQMTLFAITACALLAATAFVAPRGIALAVPAADRSAASGADGAPRGATDRVNTSRERSTDGDTGTQADAAGTEGGTATQEADTAGSNDAATGRTATAEGAPATTKAERATAASDEPAVPNGQVQPPGDAGEPSSTRDRSADVSDAESA